MTNQLFEAHTAALRRIDVLEAEVTDLKKLASGRLAIIEQMRSERDAARAEARHLREALLHRCAVNKIEDQCPECLQIIAVLDDTTATPAPAGDVAQVARALIARSPFFVTIDPRGDIEICQFCSEDGRHAPTCEWLVLEQALTAAPTTATPAPAGAGDVERLTEALGQAIEAVTWMLEDCYRPGEDPGPCIRTDLGHWKALLVARAPEPPQAGLCPVCGRALGPLEFHTWRDCKPQAEEPARADD